MHALAAVRNEIRSRDGSARCKYLRDFNQAYRKYDRAFNPQEFEDRIAAASMLLVGDYHALAASQQFAAELLERVAQRSRVVLGVEAVVSRDQQILNSWWRREIDEAALRQRLRFDREWGYDWQPFYSLLTSARDHSDGIYGLDCFPREDLRSIRSRDRHATAKLGEVRRLHPQAVILVLFGESHFAPQHLPALLQDALPEERLLTVLQNLDAHYWQALGEGASAVQLSDQTVCVFNASPLEKYESYRLCLEKWNAAAGNPGAGDAAEEDTPDYAPAIYNLIFSLARSLGFRLDSPHNGTQPKLLRESIPEVVFVSADEKNSSQKSVHPGCAYISDTNTIAVREFNMFAAAREAARFLHCACSGRIGERTESSAREEYLAHFGARLLCPGISDEVRLSNPAGEKLYQQYLAGTLSRADLRQMFLAHS